MLLLLIKVYGIFLHAEIIRIITDVDAEIDAALYRRYTTPFADRSQFTYSITDSQEPETDTIPNMGNENRQFSKDDRD